MDRKALIRAYKESCRPMGVFRVRNTVNGMSFVGSSTDLPGMLNRQRWQLGMGMHANWELQKAWNEVGPDGFVFEIVDTLAAPERPDYDPSEDLRALEELWLDRLSPFDDRGYNARPSELTHSRNEPPQAGPQARAGEANDGGESSQAS